MAAHNRHPVLFPLSNRTPEASARDAYTWTQGRALIATDQQGEVITLGDGQERHPRQCTTTYLFPGVGLGFLISRWVTVISK